MFLSFTQIGIFDEITWLCLSPGTCACRMALASNIQKYTFKMVLGPRKQCFIIFSEGLILFSRSDI